MAKTIHDYVRYLRDNIFSGTASAVYIYDASDLAEFMRHPPDPKLERKLSPYIIKGVLIASYFGLLPSYKIRLREQVRCSSCGRWKKGYFRIIEIPQTGGMLRICSYCEKKKMRGLKKWLGV